MYEHNASRARAHTGKRTVLTHARARLVKAEYQTRDENRQKIYDELRRKRNEGEIPIKKGSPQGKSR